MATRRIRYTGTSPAAASTVVDPFIFTGLDMFESVMVVATLTGATGGVLDVYLQMRTKTADSDPGEWVDYAHYTQITAAAGAVTKAFTVSRGSQQSTITTVGKGATPALAAGTIVGGEFGSEWRVVYVAGASTSAGASQTIDIIGTIRQPGV